MFPVIKTKWSVDEVLFLWNLWFDCEIFNSDVWERVDEPDDTPDLSNEDLEELYSC